MLAHPILTADRFTSPRHRGIARAAMAALLGMSALVLAGCEEPDVPPLDLGGSFPATPPENDNVTLLVGDGSGDLFRHQTDLDQDEGAIGAGEAEGVAQDAAGNLFRVGSGFQIMCGFPSRVEGDAPDADLDRAVTPAALTGGLGATLDAVRGFLIVAQPTATNSITVFSTTVAGSATPVEAVDYAGGYTDVAYDAAGDRLFATTNDGEIHVFDEFVNGGAFGSTTPDRVIVPFGDDDDDPDTDEVDVSVDLRSIAYDATRDVLVVSDLGASAGSATGDGSLFAFADAATADGDVSVDLWITGPDSGLQDPVDLVLDGLVVVVANSDGTSGDLLQFSNVVTSLDGKLDLAPADAEALAVNPTTIAQANVEVGGAFDSSDSDLGGFAPTILVYAETGADEIVGLDAADLTSSLFGFTADAPAGALSGLVIDGQGNAYVTDTAGGVQIVHRVALRDGDSYDDAALDRTIPATGASSGVDVSTSNGLIFVADTAGGEVNVYSICADGTAAALFTTSIDQGDPVDLDYDEFGDVLYLTLAGSDVVAIDGFLFGIDDNPDTGTDETRLPMPADSAAARVITPTDDAAAPLATSLAGIEHVFFLDALVVTDVGGAGGTDGSVMLIDGACGDADEDGTCDADGDVEVTAQVTAIDGSALGDPTDVAVDLFTGAVYVTDVELDVIVRLDPNAEDGGLLGVQALDVDTGDPLAFAARAGQDVVPADSDGVTDAQSITLYVANLPQPPAP